MILELLLKAQIIWIVFMKLLKNTAEINNANIAHFW